MGFGMTTVLLNLHNVGLFGFDSMVLAMGIAYGGLAQIMAGVMEYRRGNIFGTTAFTSYGFFWLSLIVLKLFPIMGLGEAPSKLAMAAYFFMWGLFTFIMFFGTLKTNRALEFVFISLAALFFMLTMRELLIDFGFDGYTQVTTLLGIDGVICGLSAVYLALAEVLNEVHGKTVLPVFPVKK